MATKKSTKAAKPKAPKVTAKQFIAALAEQLTEEEAWTLLENGASSLYIEEDEKRPFFRDDLGERSLVVKVAGTPYAYSYGDLIKLIEAMVPSYKEAK